MRCNNGNGVGNAGLGRWVKLRHKQLNQQKGAPAEKIREENYQTLRRWDRKQKKKKNESVATVCSGWTTIVREKRPSRKWKRKETQKTRNPRKNETGT